MQPQEQAVLDSQAAEGAGEPLMGFAAERNPLRVWQLSCGLIGRREFEFAERLQLGAAREQRPALLGRYAFRHLRVCFGEPRLSEGGELGPERVEDLVEREAKLVAEAEDALLQRRQTTDEREGAESPDSLTPRIAGEVECHRAQPVLEGTHAIEVERRKPGGAALSKTFADEDERVSRGVAIALHRARTLQQKRREALDERRPGGVILLADLSNQVPKIVAGERGHAPSLVEPYELRQGSVGPRLLRPQP